MGLKYPVDILVRFSYIGHDVIFYRQSMCKLSLKNVKIVPLRLMSLNETISTDEQLLRRNLSHLCNLVIKQKFSMQ